MAPLYDTAEGILQYLTDLEGLNRLASERSKAGYERREHLHEFCVLGRFYLDTCGNFSPITENAPADLFKVSLSNNSVRVPPVMTGEQLWIFMRGESITSSMQHPFAPPYVKCPLCGTGWTIENCHDIVTRTESDYVDISDFAGTKLADIKAIPSLEGKAKHFIDRDSIGGSGHQGEEGVRLLKTGLPWLYVKKDYVVLPGDVAFVQILVFEHEACYRHEHAKTQRLKMEETFAQAGFPKVNLITIPNEYHGGHNGRKVPYYAAPWYLAQVGDGPVFKIGWRKSVINIDWSESKKDLLGLFGSEDVTKDRHHIHAHGYDKAVEYLAKIVPALESA